jgi:protein-S-isoprenylcysteine O-methyltransferase Ste14
MRLLLKNLLFVLIAPGSLGGWIPWWLVRRWGLTVPPFGAMQWAAVACLALGAAILLLCVYEFGARGGATPAPIDAPKVLVVTGLYRHVRNPMYVGVTLALAGWALLFASDGFALYGACVFAGFNVFVLVYEEPTLEARFGEPYTRYRAAVRRWLPGRPFAG